MSNKMMPVPLQFLIMRAVCLHPACTGMQIAAMVNLWTQRGARPKKIYTTLKRLLAEGQVEVSELSFERVRRPGTGSKLAWSATAQGMQECIDMSKVLLRALQQEAA